jgi:hypothetical protein
LSGIEEAHLHPFDAGESHPVAGRLDQQSGLDGRARIILLRI